MSNSNYQEIRHKLRLMESFSGNSMSAFYNDRGDYLVFSYGTEIARVTVRGNKIINDRFYSVTTSRHQNLVKSCLAMSKVLELSGGV